MTDAAAPLLSRAMPDLRTALVAGPILLAYGLGAAALAAWLRTRKDVRTPYTRKVFHFLIFTAACVLQLKAGLPLVLLFGGLVSLIVLFAVARGEGFPFYEALARPTDRPHRTLFVMVPLVTTAVGGLLSNLLFPAFAHVGYMVGGWGDAVGEPVGTALGRHRYTVPSLAGIPATRSLEGSTAVLLMGAAAATLALWAGGLPLRTAALAGACCGIAGAAVEAFSSHGLDNLTVQVTAAGTAWMLLA